MTQTRRTRDCYIVTYQHPGLGARQSSVWGLRSDADSYAAGLPAEWQPRVVTVDRTPEIFRHCGPENDQRNPSQAIGGKCFHCGTVVTKEHARQFRAEVKP
jgi:hypothetical protein